MSQPSRPTLQFLFGALLAVSAPVLPAQTTALTIKTGPNVGERVPNFSAHDQNGREQTLQSIMGPKGLMLVFFRSADW